MEEFSKSLQLQPSTQIGVTEALANEKRASVSTLLGEAVVRWPDALGHKLHFSPAVVVLRAWNSAAVVVSRSGFPSDLREQPYGWNIVISDKASSIPGAGRMSSAYCHTALMGPPADIVINGSRLLRPCDGSASADQALMHSLIHEVGHAVEFRLMGKGFSRRERWHGEGFATWFEFDARALVPEARGQLDAALEAVRATAKDALRAGWKPYLFQGTPDDYARSYALIAVIAEGHSVAQLVSVYQRMAAENCLFEEAVQRELNLSIEQWQEEARAFVSAPRHR